MRTKSLGAPSFSVIVTVCLDNIAFFIPEVLISWNLCAGRCEWQSWRHRCWATLRYCALTRGSRWGSCHGGDASVVLLSHWRHLFGKAARQSDERSPDNCRLEQAVWVSHWNWVNILQESCRCDVTCIPRARWESANDMLKGDMMTFGCSGVVSRFCSSCKPIFWIAAAIASLDCWRRLTDTHPWSWSSSDEPPFGRLLMFVVAVGASVEPAVSGADVSSFSAFYRQKNKTLKYKVQSLIYFAVVKHVHNNP